MTKLQVDRLSSLYIWGAEEVLAGNSMIYRIKFREKLELERVWRSYRCLVRERPELRVKLVAKGTSNSFSWEQLDESETLALLKKEEQSLSDYTSQEVVESEYHETNSRLPFRIAVTEDKTLFLIVNHVFTGGRGGLYWFREWLIRYQNRDNSEAPQTGDAVERKPAAIARLPRAMIGVFWVLVYMINFLFRVGKDPQTNTIDLTHGRTCSKNDKGYSSKNYIFSEDTTRAFASHVRTQGHSVSVELLVILARVFFEMFPQKRRILISIPTDLREMLPWIEGSRPGNFTGSLIVQLSREGDLVKQMRREFKWIARGVPYFLPRLMAFVQNEFKAKENFHRQATTAIPERAPFENFTLAFSNPGKIRLPELAQSCEWFSGHAKTQTIFFGVAELSGRLSIEVGISNALFDKQEVFRVTDRIAEKIEEIKSSSAESH